MALTLLGNLLWNPMKLVSLKVTALGGVPLCENLMQRSPSLANSEKAPFQSLTEASTVIWQ